LVGFSGFEPTWEAIRAGKRVALATKESLVVGGELIARTRNRPLLDQIIPIDSEHSAIWQCIQGINLEQVDRIWLTASGGPFLRWDQQQLENVTVEQALAHPNWRMGPKITIDSATLMNKGFEVLEARWLFGLDLSQIKVVIHPQSIIHSLVELVDGSLLAQLGAPDMRLPIQFALTFPERVASPWPRLNLFGQNWSFQEPDSTRFPCLELAYRAGEAGGTLPACLNAVNELAVDQFRKGKIKFAQIPQLIESVMERHTVIQNPDFEDLVEADRWARCQAEEIVVIKYGGR
ncbi:MAG TPA: 1-deoxy-D-xylulose-5-phosphate reductoisomerase, partial [Firmicutes bacterium]|nr:1-deoxy-D-xylulose-5-phosphate reductoisomerase [Bacillota bacterium]